MCEPITLSTLAYVAIGTSVLGTAVSVAGAISQGNSAKKQATYNAKVQENNAILADRQAADALQRGRLEERQKRLDNSRREGSQRAALSANNVDMGTGSASDVLAFTAGQNELEALTIRSGAEREAAGFKASAANARSGAALTLAEGASAKTASLFKAGGSILSGASQTASSAFGFKKAGAFA